MTKWLPYDLEGRWFPEGASVCHQISVNKVSHFSNSGVLIIFTCCAFCRVNILTDVCWSVGRLSFSSVSRHIIISIPEWDFSDLLSFSSRLEFSVSRLYSGFFKHRSSEKLLLSNFIKQCFCIYSHCFSFWRLLYWEINFYRGSVAASHLSADFHFCTQKVSFLPIGHTR